MRCYPSRWLWGLIPIAMLSWIAVQNEGDRLERDLEERSRRVLEGAGLDWASIVFSGRDGMLVGTADRQQERTQALTLVDGVWGVRIVEDRVRLAADPISVSTEHLAADEPGQRPPQGGAVAPERPLPPAVPLQARTFAAAEGNALVLADAVPATAVAPAAVALPRPQAVVVVTRENDDLPGPAPQPRDAPSIVDVPTAKPGPAPARANVPPVAVATREIEDLPGTPPQSIDAPAIVDVPTAKPAQAPAGVEAPPVTVVTREIEDPEETSPRPADAPVIGEAPTAKAAPAPAPAPTHAPGRAQARPVTESPRADAAKPAPAAQPTDVPPVADASRLVTVVRREDEAPPVPTAKKATDAPALAPLPSALPRTEHKSARVPVPSKKSLAGRGRSMAAVEKERPQVPLPPQKATVMPPRIEDAGRRRPMDTAAVGDDGSTAECHAAILSIGMAGEIRFALGEADIDKDGRALLDRLAEVVRACPEIALSIAGHTDARGPAQRNLVLSRRRARAAVRYLVNKGIDARRLQAVGYGEGHPVAPNDTAGNRAKNRRIEVVARDLATDPQVSPGVTK